jgi:hypothetical protein
LFDVVPVEECWRETGRGPVSTKWVDVNKGSEDRPDVRCRLVARDYKPKGEKDREDLFAAMPPLEAKKMLFKLAASQWGARGREKVKLMFIDVKKAHLNGVVEDGDKAYIELPEEAAEAGMCGRLRRWLYGIRPAASAWEKDYAGRLESVGFRRGKAAPTVFFNEGTEVRCVVHGDDFTFLGRASELCRIKGLMQEWYQVKVRAVLGDDPEDDKRISILNRTLVWGPEGLRYEADRKHL